MKFNNIRVLYLKGDDYDQDFINHACCITHLFLRLLGNYEVGEHRIMVIDLVPPSLQDIRGHVLKKNEFIIADRVLEYYMNFDITIFQGYSEEEKKQCLWNIIFEVMTKAAVEYKWDLVHLKNTYDKGMEAGLKNEYYFKDYKISPDKKFKAIVRADFQMKKGTFNILKYYATMLISTLENYLIMMYLILIPLISSQSRNAPFLYGIGCMRF
ncbi:hypothetical protein [Chitinophaga defluvii]|uniref:Uncharacterized protein n=1 Tax=Chitinophaga defluvii TaxID=3163343 RepID=A0ABV2TC31_9BACT